VTASHHDDGTGTDRWMFQGHDYPTRKAMCEARRAEYVRLLAEEGMNLDWLQCIRQSDEGRMTWNWRPTMADPKHPRHYDEAFKRQIVQSCESGKPSREIRAEYDIARSTPRCWVQGIRNSGSTPPSDTGVRRNSPNRDSSSKKLSNTPLPIHAKLLPVPQFVDPDTLLRRQAGIRFHIERGTFSGPEPEHFQP